jgi:hypothetical protein
MPVVVNELEVVVAPPADAAAPGGGAAPEPPPPLDPREVAALLERRARHALRLFAH